MPVIGLPLEVSSARPRTAVIEPSVIINGGKSPMATPIPFTMPTARPASIATTSGTISGRSPLPSSAARMPVNATVEPTDISNPPAIMTNIMPNARMPLMEACLRMLTRLFGLMKLGFRMVSATTSTIKIRKMKYSLISPLRFFCFMLFPFLYTSSADASVMMRSCENSLRFTSPERLPSHITMMRSQTPISSGISDEIMITALPCCTSLPSSR